ncbi:microtubule-associated protein CRIPT-domain-containing protein [Podospora appendiculata]|uniref:Cysteine-rich PDZ-binding protein n=1 Tax=Podospora appendiculata TaxID=314037 RepID=A0AAE1CFQ8_9PEZI|nr:microtubule-associated protein CRIPT-domain-containing protein [Podospora appendiculata]
MVCAKCQKLTKTTLATPGVKKKSEMYHGSAASSSSAADKKSATAAPNGISKSKLLSKAAKNPYAHSCTKCKVKVSQGYMYCNNCAFKANSCASCGKSNIKSKSAVPTVNGQKFTLK